MKIPCDLNSLIYFDIETIPHDNPSEYLISALCKLKPVPVDENGFATCSDLQWFNANASLYAEFSKVICISAGVIREGTIRFKSYCGRDEKTIIKEFFDMVISFQSKISGLCGHNIKAFDAPYLAKRAAINGIMSLPDCFELYAVKPWESKLLDTAELWKSGQFGSPSKLEMLCNLLNIPSPKDEMDGSMVAEYFNQGKLDAISKYCEADVLATARLLEQLSTGKYTI